MSSVAVVFTSPLLAGATLAAVYLLLFSFVCRSVALWPQRWWNSEAVLMSFTAPVLTAMLATVLALFGYVIGMWSTLRPSVSEWLGAALVLAAGIAIRAGLAWWLGNDRQQKPTRMLRVVNTGPAAPVVQSYDRVA